MLPRKREEADAKKSQLPEACDAAPQEAQTAAHEGSGSSSAGSVLGEVGWSPRWSVVRHVDALPGQNAGAVRIGEGLGVLATAARCKAFCEAKGMGGFIYAGGHAYFRKPAVEVLEEATVPMKGSCLCINRVRAAPAAKEAAEGEIRVAVLASQDEFEETLYVESDVEVSTAGNGRRYATHALLRCLAAAPGVALAALLILDWRSDEAHSSALRPLPQEGPELLEVRLHHGPALHAWRGSREQLLMATAGELEVDIAIATVPRYDMLCLLHGGIAAGRYCLMGHDYQLPYGPWGTREGVPERHEMHCRLLDSTTALCTSEHLAEYLRRWSEGRMDARVCYCASYGYFDSEPLPALAQQGELVTFISPCPAKGLSIFQRLALSLPDAKFLAVSTLWTRTIHEAQLQKLPNVEIVRGGPDVGAIYARTAVLLVPSVWCEAFGLVALEAQLRGIPVVSTDAYGLREANLVPELRVPDVLLVQDMKIRTLHQGKTIDELEQTLPPARSEKGRTEEQRGQAAYHAHFHVATAAEAAGFLRRLEGLLADPARRLRLGRLARERALAFVAAQRGGLRRQLAELRAATR